MLICVSLILADTVGNGSDFQLRVILKRLRSCTQLQLCGHRPLSADMQGSHQLGNAQDSVSGLT